MTVRSKPLSAQSEYAKANVVKLATTRTASAKRAASSKAQLLASAVSTTGSAQLLSIRQHLRYVASIGTNDISLIEQSYSTQAADKLLVRIRELLDKEFGHLRVHRRHQHFVVNHYCMETLCAGLYRVQFHGHQIPLPVTNKGTGMSKVCGVPLTWGVGNTMLEAEAQRNEQTP